jgi:hypothetical protein
LCFRQKQRERESNSGNGIGAAQEIKLLDKYTALSGYEMRKSARCMHIWMRAFDMRYALWDEEKERGLMDWIGYQCPVSGRVLTNDMNEMDHQFMHFLHLCNFFWPVLLSVDSV